MTQEQLPTLRPFTGGCHCGAIRYSVLLDPANLKPSRCNCSICYKKGNLIFQLPDDSALKLLQPSSYDSPELGDYQFGTKGAHHYFCKTCGVSVIMRGVFVYEGQEMAFRSVNGLTIDQGCGKEGEEDEGKLDLSKVKVQYWNGLENDWKTGLSDVPFPGGSI